MSKRFTDTEIWQKEWFLRYSLKQKVLLRFLFDNCDVAGVYEPNWTLLSVYIGEKTTEEDILSLNQDKIHVIKLESGYFFLVDFIRFQYGELSEECRPHQPVLKSLRKHNINPKDIQTLIDEYRNGIERVSKELDKGIDTLSKGYAKGSDTLEEKEKDIINNKIYNLNIYTQEEKEEKSKKEEKEAQNELILPKNTLPDKKTDNQNSENEALFNEFWSLYTPVKSSDGRVVAKGSKEEAKKKFLNILKGGENYATILRGLQNYIEFCRENDQLTCGVAVFLNQKRWLDDYNCQTVDAESGRGQRQEPASVLEGYAELISKC